MTLREAQQAVKKLGITIRKTREGEYRMNYTNGREATAYYATDLDDAVATAEDYFKRANSQRQENPMKQHTRANLPWTTMKKFVRREMTKAAKKVTTRLMKKYKISHTQAESIVVTSGFWG